MVEENFKKAVELLEESKKYLEKAREEAVYIDLIDSIDFALFQVNNFLDVYPNIREEVFDRNWDDIDIDKLVYDEETDDWVYKENEGD